MVCGDGKEERECVTCHTPGEVTCCLIVFVACQNRCTSANRLHTHTQICVTVDGVEINLVGALDSIYHG